MSNPTETSDDLRDRENALSHIQTIAYDGELLADAAVKDTGVAGAGDDFARAIRAKLQRIVNIAESGKPDEDWPGYAEELPPAA